MSDREPSHQPSPATARAPAPTTSPPPPAPPAAATTAATPDLTPATPTTQVKLPIPTDLAEDEDAVELLDWDEEDIDGQLVADGEGVGTELLLMESKTSEPSLLSNGSGGSTTLKHPRPSGVTPPSPLGPVGEARVGHSTAAPPTLPCLAIDALATTMLPPPPASATAASLHQPPVFGPVETEVAGKAPPAKLKSVLVCPATSVGQPRARKTVWQRLSSGGSMSQAAHSSKAPASQLPASLYSSAKLWEQGESSRGEKGEPSRLNDCLDETQGGQLSPKWQAARSKHRGRHESPPLRDALALERKKKEEAREAFKKRNAGRCYRCLASDHFLAQCREPARCWACKGIGHFSRSCPSRRQQISAHLRSRLTFPQTSIHSRITFPPLHQSHNAPPPRTTAAADMEYVPGQASQRPTRAHVNIASTEGVMREANRLRTHAVFVSAPLGGYQATATEVAYALWGQLHIPRHDIKVSRHGRGKYVAEFELPTERDRAMGQGSVLIGGQPFPVTPWISAGSATQTTWWFHVRVAMENVPLEAWNEEGVKLVLGDTCIFDRLDSRTLAREETDLLTCWIWMEDPDDLPRSLTYTIFAFRAGQAMVINGLPAPTRLPATPPVGLEGDKVILIHIDGYEDWRPSSPNSGSGTSSEHGSSGPRFVPFDWTRGVLDGRPAAGRRVHHGNCRPPASTYVRRDDHDDNNRGPRPREDAQRGPRVRQLFSGCTSGRAVRVRTGSPPTYRQALLEHSEPMDGGRTMLRSPPRSGWEHDGLDHAAEGWERRRSRSPPRRGPNSNFLQAPPLLQDPLADMFAAPKTRHDAWGFDPMILESQRMEAVMCHQPASCYSPDDGLDKVPSPEYVPVSGLWTDPVAQDSVLFGPGVQLPVDSRWLRFLIE